MTNRLFYGDNLDVLRKNVQSESVAYTRPVNCRSFPRVQIITVPELLNFQRPKMPLPLPLYISAVRRPKVKPDQLAFGHDEDEVHAE
jgi:hypothetical protein